MSFIPTKQEALSLLKEYNKEDFHIRHGEVVGGVMGYFAKEYDPGRVENRCGNRVHGPGTGDHDCSDWLSRREPMS